MTDRAVIFSTLGDAGGIGPEVLAKALRHGAMNRAKLIVAGPRAVWEAGCQAAGVDPILPVFQDPQEAIADSASVVLLDFNPTGERDFTRGSSSRKAGDLDLALARLAVDLYRKGSIEGIVFPPVNKHSLHLSDPSVSGYKPYIAELLGERQHSAELNTIGDLWVTRVSSHIPLSEVARHVTRENVIDVIRYFDRELRRLDFAQPKIAVAGLNPHNGDGGMFGREEIEHIAPAVNDARSMGIDVAGPFPPDTIFLTVRNEGYLGVVSMYHDQGQIATRLISANEVSYFGGLSLPITTPSHGTAYDIAGKGVASEGSMVQALALLHRAVLSQRDEKRPGPDFQSLHG